MTRNNENIPNLLYILSAGHSGSTLLDFVIGSLPKAFSTGELVYFPWQIHRNLSEIISKENQNICTCGKSFLECEVWGKVIDTINKNNNINLKVNPFAFDISMHRSLSYIKNRSLYNKIKRNLYYLTNKNNYYFSSNIFYNYYFESIKRNWLLYQYIQSITKAKFIIDSSKDPIRFNLLHRMYPRKTQLIVLVREVYGVAISGIIRNEHNNVQKAAKGWLRYYNKKVLDLINSIDDVEYLIIRYEDLTKFPTKVLAIIANFLKVEYPAFNNYYKTSDYHLIAGNPMRYKNNFKIEYDLKWKDYINKNDSNVLQNYQDQLDNIFTKSQII